MIQCNTDLRSDKDISDKVVTLFRMCGTRIRTLSKHCRKQQLKFYRTVAALCGCKIWVIRQSDELAFRNSWAQSKVAEMMIWGRRLTCSHYLWCSRYHNKCHTHLLTVKANRLSKLVLGYEPFGRRSAVRPMKRWTCQLRQTLRLNR